MIYDLEYARFMKESISHAEEVLRELDMNRDLFIKPESLDARDVIAAACHTIHSKKETEYCYHEGYGWALNMIQREKIRAEIDSITEYGFMKL